MENIQGAGRIDRADNASRFRHEGRLRRATSSARARPPDRADISAEAKAIARLSDMPPVRHDKVEAARQLIADPTINLDTHLEKAMRQLIAEEFGA